jgi:hypothetical protein
MTLVLRFKRHEVFGVNNVSAARWKKLTRTADDLFERQAERSLNHALVLPSSSET